MNTQLPVPERTLPPESADRIRTAVLFDELDPRGRRANRWLLGLAAALVVIALLATAAVLWPSARQTQVVATPTPTPTPTPTGNLVPRMRATPPQSPGPPSTREPYPTDRGPLSATTARRVIKECLDDGKVTGEILRARRASNGVDTFQVVLYRADDGRVWQCSAGSSFTPLENDAEVGPNPSAPIVTEPGTQSGDSKGVAAEWVYRALPSVRRVRVRALIEGRSTRWFESEVHEGLAFVPTFTAGRFDYEKGQFPLFYEHRAFDADGREIPVTVVGPR